MLSSCEAAFTESLLIDTDKTVSAGQGNKVSETMRIQVTEEVAERLLSQRDADGVISPEILSEVGLGPEDGISQVSTTFMIGGKFEGRQRASGLHLWFDLRLDPNAALTKSVGDFNKIPGISKVESAARIKPMSVMNDPNFNLQWHYHNTGANGFLKGFDIGLEEMWRRYEVYGSPDVIIAVCDGGFDVTHPDLIGNLWTNEAELNGQPGVDDDRNGYIDDVHGYNFAGLSSKYKVSDHGTHVAGTVAAVNNNEIGLCGVAGGKYPQKGARVMLLQVLNGDYNNYLKAMQYAAENGAVISQNSWGYIDDVAYILDSDKKGVDYFIDNAGLDENGNQVGPMKGGLMVFATGNDARDMNYPAAYDRCLAVSAIGPTGKVAYYSNYGDWVDVSAPGGDVKVNRQFGGVFSTVLDGKYDGMQGTSMACPHVSGLAALILDKAKGQGYTSAQLYDHIISTSDPYFYELNPDKVGLFGAGMIDAVRAIAKFSKIAPEAPVCAGVKAVSNNLEIELNVPKDEDDSTAFYYNIYLSDKPIKDVNDASVVKRVVEIERAKELDNKNRYVVVDRLDFEKDYYCAVIATDYAGNQSAMIDAGTFKTQANNKPILEINDTAPIFVTSSDIVTRTFTYSEPDGHAVVPSFSTTATTGIEFADISAGLCLVKVDGATSEDGTFEFTVTVTDEYGLANSITCTYEVDGNNAPVLVKNIDDMLIGGVDASAELNVSEYFTDEDNDVLNLSFVVEDKNVASATAADGKITVKGVGFGSTKIKVTASDAAGEAAEAEFTVTVYDPSKPYSMYPNPVTDVLNIRGTLEENVSIKLYSAAGQTVYDASAKISVKDVHTADLSKLAPGVYKVAVDPENGDRYTSTIVKL